MTRNVATDVTGGGNIGATMLHNPDGANHHPGVSENHREPLPVRLAGRWGTTPQRAKWLTYHMERGIRGGCLDVIAEMGTVKASEWFAPVEEALAHGPVVPFPESIQQLQRAAATEQAARDAYLLNPTVQNRRALIAASRQHVGASRQLARSLEAIP